MLQEIWMPVVSLGVLGLVFGALLGVAAKVFYVEKDERIDQIAELLPGANCGGCGYAGCVALAEAIVKKEALPSACTVLKEEGLARVAAAAGVNDEPKTKQVARVLCKGSCDKTTEKCVYQGVTSCSAAVRYGGGEKSCMFSCIGYGDCERSCKFDAIHVVNGLAQTDEALCTACAACVKACPRNIIELIDIKQKTYVACRSKQPGKEVRLVCSAGCIGCGICEKNCPEDAIHVKNHLAEVDYERCVNCGICVAKCPTKVIEYVSKM